MKNYLLHWHLKEHMASNYANHDGRLMVSVIVPVFNDASGALRCLRGIAGQSHPASSIEVIVVDNASDPPLAIEEEFPFTVKTVHCEKPGSYAARNAGVGSATGEILAFIDADCWPDEHWLQRGIGILQKAGAAAAIGGEVTYVVPSRRTPVALYQCITGFGQKANVVDKHFSATANLICRRETFDTIGGFDERLLSGGDREWCWRAISRSSSLQYAAESVVYTEPRATLRGAIRQARRVTAGRKMLLELGLAHVGVASISRNRSAWQSARWILRHPGLSNWERLRVLTVAGLIRAASAVEACILALGGRAERR